MITKNFDSMQRTILYGRIWPAGVSNINNITEAHYLQDDNTVVRYCSPFSTSEFRLQSFAAPLSDSSSGMNPTLKYIQLGEQTSTDEVILAEDYYDYKMTHPIASSSMYYALTSNDIKLITENGVSYLHITHLFTNLTGSTKLIREIALYQGVRLDAWSSNGYIMIYRKVLPTYQEVAANGTINIDLKIPMTALAPNKPSA